MFSHRGPWELGSKLWFLLIEKCQSRLLEFRHIQNSSPDPGNRQKFLFGKKMSGSSSDRSQLRIAASRLLPCCMGLCFRQSPAVMQLRVGNSLNTHFKYPNSKLENAVYSSRYLRRIWSTIRRQGGCCAGGLRCCVRALRCESFRG